MNGPTADEQTLMMYLQTVVQNLFATVKTVGRLVFELPISNEKCQLLKETCFSVTVRLVAVRLLETETLDRRSTLKLRIQRKMTNVANYLLVNCA